MGEQQNGRGRANRGPAAAASNRRSLIAAAREVFSERGLDVPFSAIAARAGLGQGTLYRHFPSKMALAAAVFESNIDELEQSESLHELLDMIEAQIHSSAAILVAMLPSPEAPETQSMSERFVALVAKLHAQDIAAGRIDPAVDAADVLLVAQMLARLAAGLPPEQRREAVERARALATRALGTSPMR